MKKAAAFLTLVLIFSAGCARSVSYDPKAPQTFYYEQSRSVSVSLFQTNFVLNEIAKYRQDITAVGESDLEMTFVPIDYRVASSSGDGVQNIFGTGLLPQSNESEDVSLMRAFGHNAIRIRADRSGNVLKASIDANVFGEGGPRRDAAVARATNLLTRTIVSPHLMLTQAILPAQPVEVGKAYKPAGFVMDLENDEFGQLMKVASIDDKGVATLAIDSSVVASLFNKAGGLVDLPRHLGDKLEFSGDGAGSFLYDTARHCVTSGNVNLSAVAKAARTNMPASRVTVRMNLSIREIPAP